MPKDKKPGDRYRRIHEIFTRRSGSGAVVKLDWLAEELGISLRQLNDDIKYLKEKGAPLEYVAALRGWRYEDGRNFAIVEDILISDDEMLHISQAMYLFNKINTGDKKYSKLPDIFHKIYKASRKWTLSGQQQKHIYFDPLPVYEGAKYLSFFLNAIEDSRRVSFQYQPFHSKTPKTVVFDPWFLRHYERRWYVGGYSHDPNELFVRTFPLERIEGAPQQIGWFHEKPPQYDAATYWKHIYGITVPQAAVETVVLKFTALQGKYFTSAPFLEEFSIVEENDHHLILSAQLIPNIDLLRKLASLGDEVHVLAPATLAEQLQAFYRKALERYQK